VSLHYLVKHERVVCVQSTGAGRSGQHGTSAAVRAVKVKGQGHVSVSLRPLRTEVECVTATRCKWTNATGHLAPVSLG